MTPEQRVWGDKPHESLGAAQEDLRGPTYSPLAAMRPLREGARARAEAGSCDSAPGERRGRWGNSNSFGLIYCQEGAHRESHYFQPHLPLDDTWIINNSKTNNVLLHSRLLFIQSPTFSCSFFKSNFQYHLLK